MKCIFWLKFTSGGFVDSLSCSSNQNTYVKIYIVVCHPVEDIVGKVLPGLVLAEHDEEGEEGCESGDDTQRRDHLYCHPVRQRKVTNISH